MAAGNAENVRGEDLRKVVLDANADGIDLLRRGQTVMAFEQLKYAEAVLVSNPEISADENELLALTCSNLGCYYRKAGLPRAALRYLGRALRAEKAADSSAEPQDACALATTKLNACAALSGVGRHEEAEKLAVVAMQLLTPQDGAGPSKEECALLAVACHNLGAEREHLGRWAPAAVAYRQGSEVARKVLGPKSPLTKTLQDRCAQALSKAERNPFMPRRPTSMRRRQSGRPNTAPKATSWPGRCPPLQPLGGSWEGMSDNLHASAVAANQDVQGEEACENASPTESVAGRLEQDLGVGNGAVEMEEDVPEEDEEFASEMRGRFLPSLASQPEGTRGSRNITMLEDCDTSPQQQPRSTWAPAAWNQPSTPRRWSATEQQNGAKAPQTPTGATPPRFTHGSALNSLVALPESQDMGEWAQSPQPNAPSSPSKSGSMIGRGDLARGSSARSMSVSYSHQPEVQQYQVS